MFMPSVDGQRWLTKLCAIVGYCLKRRAEGGTLTGRLMRKPDAATWWLWLVEGGYVQDANLVEPGGPALPILITFTNSGSGFGTAIDGYSEHASVVAQTQVNRAIQLPPEERRRELAA